MDLTLEECYYAEKLLNQRIDYLDRKLRISDTFSRTETQETWRNLQEIREKLNKLIDNKLLELDKEDDKGTKENI